MFKKNKKLKKALFITAAANRAALLTAVNDGAEASRGEVGDTLMNQFPVQHS